MVHPTNNPKQHSKSGPIIEIKGLTKRFGDFTAVDNIDLSINSGEIFSLLGPNGAGKTTVINLILGIIRPSSGKIIVDGSDNTTHQEQIKNKIGFLTQETVVETELTATQNLRLFAELYHVPAEQQDARIKSALKEAQLEKFADARAGTFSGGMQRRLALVKSMVHNPKILILDEPTTGLDVQNRLRMWEDIRELRSRGTTIIMTTQYLEESDALSDRIAIIDHGKIKVIGTASELKRTVSSSDVIEIVSTMDDASKVAHFLKARFDLSTNVIAEKVSAPLGSNGRQKFIKIASALEKQHFAIIAMSMHLPTLDDVFIKVTGSALRDTASEAGTSALTRTMARR